MQTEFIVRDSRVHEVIEIFETREDAVALARSLGYQHGGDPSYVEQLDFIVDSDYRVFTPIDLA